MNPIDEVNHNRNRKMKKTSSTKSIKHQQNLNNNGIRKDKAMLRYKKYGVGPNIYQMRFDKSKVYDEREVKEQTNKSRPNKVVHKNKQNN